jgi:hypothetical protein
MLQNFHLKKCSISSRDFHAEKRSSFGLITIMMKMMMISEIEIQVEVILK